VTTSKLYLFVNVKGAIKIKLGNNKSEYIELEGEDHWFSSGNSRRIFLEESLRFINKHI
jgi:dipeptidyl aminopeptidase/acylaminoacyl peptidase